MALELSLKEFEDMNLYSNKSIEAIVSSIVNESSNAALVNMFEDSVILLDHDNGTFYTSDFEFDPKTLTLKLENFEEIFLSKEEECFKGSVKSFFEGDTLSVDDLAESYKENVIEQEAFINELINEALSVKNFEDTINYSELAEANDDVSIKNDEFFKFYTERLETHPLKEAVFFNFEDKVVVSLLESERVKLINSTASEKASSLWKRPEFATQFAEAAETFIEDVEAGKESFLGLFEEFPQVFFLDKADRKAMFGKTIIANADIRESLKVLLKGMDILFEDEDIESLRDNYLSEAEGDEPEEPAEGEEPAEKEEAPAKELTSAEIKKLSKELKGVAEKVEDEKLKEKLDDIIGKLDGGLEEGTRPDLVKEAVYLLSI
jgi:hypothetical protein